MHFPSALVISTVKDDSNHQNSLQESWTVLSKD